MKKIYIEFEGYKWDSYTFPETDGIYAIYSTYSSGEGRNVGKLQYIGKSNNLNRRIKEHACSDYPRENKYCYSFCELYEDECILAEAALINRCKCGGNTDFVDNYPYENVSLYISGEHKDIPTKIIIVNS